MPRQLNIIARKPRDEFNEFVVIDRGPAYDPHDLRYVSATSNRICAAGGEWFWGNYFRTKAEAMAHFDARVSAPIDTSRSNIVVVEGDNK